MALSKENSIPYMFKNKEEVIRKVIRILKPPFILGSISGLLNIPIQNSEEK